MPFYTRLPLYFEPAVLPAGGRAQGVDRLRSHSNMVDRLRSHANMVHWESRVRMPSADIRAEPGYN